MTNKEIMKASLLDIVFDNRNKEYGAYVLRRDYPNRLWIALVIALCIIGSVLLLSSFVSKKFPATNHKPDENTVIITTVVLPKHTLQLPVKEVQLPKQTKPSARLPFTSQIKIEKDDVLRKTDVPDINELIEKEIDTKNGDGLIKTGTVNPYNNVPMHDGNGIIEEVPIPAKEIILSRSYAEFPGGDEAMIRFFERNLNTPGELSEGEKKKVQVRFKIDKEGVVSSLEIYKSGGEVFDKEVIRVCKKMPRWKPAMQNGITVPVSFVIPVTFIVQEQ